MEGVASSDIAALEGRVEFGESTELCVARLEMFIARIRRGSERSAVRNVRWSKWLYLFEDQRRSFTTEN